MKALITGATSGIGEALFELLKEKYTVIRTGRNAEKRPDLICDLSQEREPLIHLIQEVVPDLVINCAGFGLYGPAVELSLDDQLALFEVNVKAVYEVTVEAAKALLQAKKPGTICNISSVAGYLCFPHFAAYAASKACVTHFSQSLDSELKEQGIRVLASCPGQVKTAFRQRASQGVAQKKSRGLSPKAAAKHILRQIERGRGVSIFPWPLHLVRLLPKSFLNRVLRASIDRRR